MLLKLKQQSEFSLIAQDMAVIDISISEPIQDKLCVRIYVCVFMCVYAHVFACMLT